MTRAALSISGIFPPLTTPFDAAGELDLTALTGNVKRYDQTELAGYVAFGSSGEAVHLSQGERGLVLSAVRDAAAPGRLLIAGVNEQSSRSTLAAIHQAADCGADAALVITPYFYKSAMTQEALRSFFLAVAEDSPLPVLAYNIPQNTGVTLAPATVATLAEHPNLVGIKDSSGNLDALSTMVRTTPDDFSVLVGHAGILYPALVMGAAGGILAAACVAPEACLEVLSRVAGGDHAGARSIQDRLAPLSNLVTTDLGIPGLKAACSLVGYQGGLPRAPLAPVPEARERITRVLKETGLVTLRGERPA